MVTGSNTTRYLDSLGQIPKVIHVSDGSLTIYKREKYMYILKHS